MLKVTTSQEVNQRLKNLPLRKKDKPFKFETSWAERGRRCKTTIQVAFINMFSYLPVFTVHSFTKAQEAFLLLLCLYSQRVWKHNLLMSDKSLQHPEVNIFIFMNQLKANMHFWAKERAFFPIFLFISSLLVPVHRHLLPNQAIWSLDNCKQQAVS